MGGTDRIEADREPLAAGTSLQAGGFRIERLLGRGGFALAYLARQGRWNFSVCVKEFFPLGCAREANGIRPLTPEAEQRFRTGLQKFNDEAAVLGRFNHPGIVRVLGAFTENGTAYLVQEVLQGITLSDGLSMAGKMKLWNVMRVAQQVGQALLMVHAAGLVHSDLKPENIFITREGRYVLLDFGLTRGLLSASGAEIGGRGLSAGYSPPEQYIPGHTLTPATDVYGFAATLYCLLTGMAPPDAHQRSLGQPLPAMRPMNRTITTRVQRALQNAMALDARQRTPGIREFLHELGLDSTPKAVGWRPAQFRAGPSVFRAHPTGITTLALHSPTARLYSGGRDGTIKIWNWPTMEALGSVPTHAAPVSALAVSDDGMYVVSGSERGEIKLQPTAFDHAGLLLNPAGPGVNALAFHGNSLVAAALADGACCLFGPSLPQPVHWIAHAGSTNGVDFPPLGDMVVTAGDDRMVRLWQIPELKVIFEFVAHEKSVQCVQFSPDGTSLLTASQDQSLKFWDLQGGGLVRDMRGHQAVVSAACFSSLEKMVITLAGDHSLRAFHLSSSRMAFCSDAKNERTRALAVDTLRPLVATGAKDGGICVWEFSDQVERQAQVQADAPPEEAAVAEEAEDKLVGQRLGHYLITALLGSGGMARVYKAMPVGNSAGESVAIKVIRPDHVSLEFQQRFDREIQLSYKLDHPNVLRTLDWGRETNLTYLVMEFVEGMTLKEVIPAGGMHLAQAMPVLHGVIAALAYAHSLGIVHRDLKPENVMIARDGRVLLMDFGLARDREVTTVTRPGSAIGTAEYMAPEQVLRGPDRSALTEKTDQYALGVLVFELLTGRRPFEWDDPVKLINMHLTQEPPALTTIRQDLPVAVEAVVARMLRKEVDERFPSVTEAGEALFEAMALARL